MPFRLGLARVRNDWNRHAHADPLWAILTDPGKKGGGWDPDAFFATGEWEIDEVLRYAATLHVPLGHARALDFGCGAGRLTRALAGHFDEAWGVDISPAMIELARSYAPQAKFVVSQDPSLATLPARDFDFIYSNITLQHMPPRYARRYLLALVGRLRPGGLMIFQLPSESRQPRFVRMVRHLYNEVLRRNLGGVQPWMDMYGISKAEVLALLESAGTRVLDVRENTAAGPEWTSYRYAVVNTKT
jgi:trans-aconitate methyltransferase